MYTEKWEIISPAIAEVYLKRNNKNNRNIRTSQVNKLASDMKCGRWEEENPQNQIVFDENNVLVDGQHRLTAIIKAGTQIKMKVVRGVPTSITHFDTQVPRSISDILVMSGMGKDVANGRTIAMINFMIRFMYNHTGIITDGIAKEYIKEYGAEMWLSTVMCQSKRGGKSITQSCPIHTAVYCAYRYGIHEDEIREFIKVVNTGIQDYPWQSTAVLLRNYIMDAAGGKGRVLCTNPSRKELFDVASRALWDYHCKVRRKQKYAPEKIEDTVCIRFVKDNDRSFFERLINGQK